MEMHESTHMIPPQVRGLHVSKGHRLSQGEAVQGRARLGNSLVRQVRTGPGASMGAKSQKCAPWGPSTQAPRGGAGSVCTRALWASSRLPHAYIPAPGTQAWPTAGSLWDLHPRPGVSTSGSQMP